MEEEKEVLVEGKEVSVFNRFADLSGNYELELEFTVTRDMKDDFVFVSWGNSSVSSSLYFGFFDYDLTISDFITGHGLQYLKKKYVPFRIGNTPKLTVQKIGDYFWYFVNEECVYWSDVVDLEVPRVSLASSNIEVDQISVKKLPD